MLPVATRFSCIRVTLQPGKFVQLSLIYEKDFQLVIFVQTMPNIGICSAIHGSSFVSHLMGILVVILLPDILKFYIFVVSCKRMLKFVCP